MTFNIIFKLGRIINYYVNSNHGNNVTILHLIVYLYNDWLKYSCNTYLTDCTILS